VNLHRHSRQKPRRPAASGDPSEPLYETCFKSAPISPGTTA
jgi:hypothetical protein